MNRRPRLTAILVILTWALVVAAAMPFVSRLTSVQRNDATDFLPSRAESTQVQRALTTSAGGSTTPAIAVYERAGGLTAADRALVASQAAQAATVAGAAGPATPVFTSADGRAAQFIVQLRSSDVTALTGEVAALRGVVRGDAGLSAHVAGPAGLGADFGAAFKGLDVKLLAGTVLVVVLILLAVYRSPFLWTVPLVAVGAALFAAQAGVYLAATRLGLPSNGQSQGLLTVLLFGAGTDYALLYISRYREELRRNRTNAAAILAALRGAGPAIVASAVTVCLALLCLGFSVNGANRSLGPTGAIGVFSAMVAMLTLLPALLLLGGRRLFWPSVPRFGSETRRRATVYERLAGLIGRRPRRWWIGGSAVLALLALGITQLAPTGIALTDQYTVAVDSVAGQKILDAHFPTGSGSPAVIVAAAGRADAVVAAAAAVPGVSSVAVARQLGSRTILDATLAAAPQSPAAEEIVTRLRAAVHAVPDAGALVGGTTAVSLDTRTASDSDLLLIVPLVLAVIAILLALLLRSLVAPAVLILTVLASFAATMGAAGLVFRLLGFPAEDSSFPLTAFVFLVALGIDYNIFLASRVREEAARLGSRPGVLAGLALTGSVITSAGIVLAATFSVFAVLPLVIFAEIGFAVAFGVLLDTLLVRTVVVPALLHDLGPRAWWPGRMAPDSPAATEVVANEAAA